jgi:hypothetical protein
MNDLAVVSQSRQLHCAPLMEGEAVRRSTRSPRNANGLVYSTAVFPALAEDHLDTTGSLRRFLPRIC